MTALEKIEKLEDLHGWYALNACLDGQGTPKGKWWVTWDNERGPEIFTSNQALHRYLNKKLGVYR